MDPPERPTAKTVGDAFAEMYYLVLKNHPTLLHKFYKDDSKISRPGLDGIMREFTFSSIDENDLNMLSSGGVDSVEVTSVTSQDSPDGGVFVVVGGYFTSNERLARNFTQTFFLAPQENGGYFASNDLFKLIDISEARASIPSANNETEEVADESLRVSEESNDGVEDVPEISDVSDVMKAIPIGQGQHASSSDHSPEIKVDAVDDTGNNQDSQASTEGSAVFVKILPPNVTNDMVENAFNKFGRVKRGGIEIKHPGLDYYFAFVEFEEANAAERAIKASPVWVGGRKVQVKKKLDLVQSYREQRRIHEEEGQQYNQNRYGSEQVRGTRVYDFWEWKKSMEEQMKKKQEEAGKLQEQEEEEKSQN